MKQFKNVNDFDDFLRNRINNHPIYPPQSLWGKISNALSFHIQQREKRYLVLFIVALLSLIVYSGTIWYAYNSNNYQSIRVNSSTAPPDYNLSRLPFPETSAPPKASSTVGLEKTFEKISPTNLLASSLEIASNNSSNYIQTKRDVKNNIPSKVQSIVLPMVTNQQSAALHFYKKSSLLQSPILVSPPLLAYIGIHRAINNTWIINQNTHQLFGDYKPDSQLDWGGAWGTHLGINLKKDLVLEIGANWMAMQGQKYKGLLYSREIDLMYHQFPIILKKRNPFKFLGNTFLGNWEIGVQYSKLLLARQEINNVDLGGIYTRFNEHEFSVLGGYSIDWSVTKHLYLNTAVRMRIGNNINAEQWKIKGGYQNSHNADIGFSIGLKYLFENK